MNMKSDAQAGNELTLLPAATMNKELISDDYRQANR